MIRSRFTETQIVSILKDAYAGMKAKEICGVGLRSELTKVVGHQLSTHINLTAGASTAELPR